LTGAATISFKYLLSCPHEAEWIPFQTHCFSESLEAPGIEPRTSDHLTTEAVHGISKEYKIITRFSTNVFIIKPIGPSMFFSFHVNPTSIIPNALHLYSGDAHFESHPNYGLPSQKGFGGGSRHLKVNAGKVGLRIA
jgi:hypothetical protein